MLSSGSSSRVWTSRSGCLRASRAITGGNSARCALGNEAARRTPALTTVAMYDFGAKYIFDTIRWDTGNDGVDFRLEIPVPNGTYQVNMYFTEECCTGRHFKIEIQGDIVDDDVSYLDYDTVAPGLGKTGKLSFAGITVTDRILHIAFLPCPDPECQGGIDGNSIIDALEIVVMLESEFGIKVKNETAARDHFRSIASLAEFVEARLAQQQNA